MKNTLITCQGIIFRRERLGCSLNDQKVFCGFQKHLLTGVLGEDFLIDRSLKSLDNFSTKKTEEGILSCNAIGILQ